MLPPLQERPPARTILVVDDDVDIREMLRTVLARAAHRVVEAEHGAEALALIEARHPDLVLLDVNMPVLNGYEACRRLKADPATRAIPVVMLTAATQDDDRERGLAAGADGYVTKPFSPGALLAQLGAHRAAA
jgi:two-component system cell cycle response regulator DivK